MSDQISALRKTQSLTILLLLLVTLFLLYRQATYQLPDVVHARGVVLEDKDGQPRMMMGFPLPDLSVIVPIPSPAS